MISARRAAEQGVSAIALDTSERASHLIEMYQSRGYHFVEYYAARLVDWARLSETIVWQR